MTSNFANRQANKLAHLDCFTLVYVSLNVWWGRGFLVARSCLGGEVTGYRSAQELSFEVFEWSHTWVSSSDFDDLQIQPPCGNWIKTRVSFFLVSDQCENTAGSYKCLCSSGLAYNPVNKTCDDINECLTSQHSCQQLCVNIRGSFHCDCNPGFLLSSDQLTCADVDECSQSSHSCQHRCVNTIGSYVCSCDSGHTLSDDGRTCDLMECGKPDGMTGIVVKCDGTANQYRLDINSRETQLTPCRPV